MICTITHLLIIGVQHRRVLGHVGKSDLILYGVYFFYGSLFGDLVHPVQVWDFSPEVSLDSF